MTPVSIAFMILVIGFFWGGFFFLVHKMSQSEHN